MNSHFYLKNQQKNCVCIQPINPFCIDEKKKSREMFFVCYFQRALKNYYSQYSIMIKEHQTLCYVPVNNQACEVY